MVSQDLVVLAGQCRERFRSYWGRPANWTVVSPGRVNLIGEHVDYNDGFVLPLAIEKHVVLVAASSTSSREASRVIRLASASQEEVVTIDLNQAIRPDVPAWGNYARGVIAAFADLGADIPAFDAMIMADLPSGGGLSSSAALEVAIATLLESIADQKLDPRRKALLCQQAEHAFAGVPCGIMDQLACALARQDQLLLLDCRSLDVQFVPFNDPQVTLLVIDSKVKHELAGSDYAQRRRECEEAAAALGLKSLRDATTELLEASANRLTGIQLRRARHVVHEINRTQQAVEAIRAGDWNHLGQLMYESHASLRADYEVSCLELDLIVELARNAGERSDGGVFGCRMTGGGFGGCAICLVRTDAKEAVIAHILSEYERGTGIAPAVFSTRPAEGARLLDSSM